MTIRRLFNAAMDYDFLEIITKILPYVVYAIGGCILILGVISVCVVFFQYIQKVKRSIERSVPALRRFGFTSAVRETWPHYVKKLQPKTPKDFIAFVGVSLGLICFITMTSLSMWKVWVAVVVVISAFVVLPIISVSFLCEVMSYARRNDVKKKFDE